MPCYRPLEGWKKPLGGLTFDRKASIGLPLQVPCGQCIGCRLQRSQEWATRCIHEAQMHQQNCFITLTYNEENLPCDGSLNKQHFQKFMKKLRKETKQKIRYYHCGEYGEQLSRPHYHACLFGFDFADKFLLSIKQGNRLFVSPTLDRVWNKGYATIGAVTYESAAYVARYILKKQNGQTAEYHYANVHGEEIQPEYTSMSLKPGIGYEWYKAYTSDVFPDDHIVLANGKKVPTPRYYRELLKSENPELYEKLKKRRIKKAKQNPDNTPERLETIEIVKHEQLKQLKRNLHET